MGIDFMQMLGMAVGIAIFILIGVIMGIRIKTKDDYYVAGQSFGAMSVAGSTAGMYIGGGFVIGSAQLAFTDGFSGWYFSVGCATALLLMAIFYAVPIRTSGHQTIQEMLRSEYGEMACLLSTLLGVVAFYINSMSHFLSGISLISSLFPLSTFICSVITAVVILLCVFTGGYWGISFINILKSIILISTVVISACVIFVVTDGYSEIASALPERYFTLTPRGANTDVGNFLSIVLGLMSTQSTIQAIFSGKSNRDCRIGFALSSIILPITGFCCVIIGLYMSATAPDMNALQAFPQFITNNTNGALSGIILSATLVAVASAGVAVMLGISGILTNNIYLRLRPNATAKMQIWFSRIVIVCLLALTTYLINNGSGDSIMQYNFLSMGFRGAVLFLPMTAALFLPKKLPKQFALAIIILGPASILLSKYVFVTKLDSTFVWLPICLIILAIGLVYGKIKEEKV